MKLPLIIVIAVLSCFPAVAQDADPNTRNVKPELKQVYKDWQEKDVVLCFLRDAREDYARLTTEEERDKFVEDYWRYREANQEKTPENERSERTSYAEEHFTSGVIGSKTDRGRIYILWGKPDKIEGGRMRIAGSDGDVPFEKWSCEGREFIFIDPAETGDYRLIKDEEKERK
jgi:GWxTD domain-containing protein